MGEEQRKDLDTLEEDDEFEEFDNAGSFMDLLLNLTLGKGENEGWAAHIGGRVGRRGGGP